MLIIDLVMMLSWAISLRSLLSCGRSTCAPNNLCTEAVAALKRESQNVHYVTIALSFELPSTGSTSSYSFCIFLQLWTVHFIAQSTC